MNHDDESWAGLGVEWLSANRVATTEELVVLPGGLGTFRVRVRAPTAPGMYRLHLRPVIDGVTSTSAWSVPQKASAFPFVLPYPAILDPHIL